MTGQTNESQRLWKLRKWSDEALIEAKRRSQQRIADIEKVQSERKGK